VEEPLVKSTKKRTKVGHKIDPKELEKLAALRMTNTQIAERLGLCERSFYEHLKKNEELANIIRIAKRKTDAYVVGKLMKLIEEGNVAATIFYLKTKCRWREAKNG
jgi:hypothetical protein